MHVLIAFINVLSTSIYAIHDWLIWKRRFVEA